MIKLKTVPLLLFFIFFTLFSCDPGSRKIVFGKDNCALCSMTIMDPKFGAALVNKNGKTLKFDSGECMVNFLKKENGFKPVEFLIIDYAFPGTLTAAEKAFYLQGGNINSPMGGALAGFSTPEAAEKVQQELGGDFLSWEKVLLLPF